MKGTALDPSRFSSDPQRGGEDEEAPIGEGLGVPLWEEGADRSFRVEPSPADEFLAFGPDDPEDTGGTGRADVRWAVPALDIDKHDLPEGSGEPFALRGEVLRILAELNSFHLPDPAEQPRVLFGLRGCVAEHGGDHTPFTDEVMLREATPDYSAQRCILGVWDLGSDEIAVFKASTTPNYEYMWWTTEYRWRGTDGDDPKIKSRWDEGPQGAMWSNLLPTGLYRYRVGAHKGRPGFFCLDQDVMVCRTMTNLTHTTRDFWDGPLNPHDNIHCSWHCSDPDFDAAGCQTVDGGYSSSSREHSGAWAAFRAAAGLSNPHDSAHDGRPFHYMLLTGREAQLASDGHALDPLRRLRIGSTHLSLPLVHRALIDGGWLSPRAVPNPRHCAWTAEAIIYWQRQGDPWPDNPLGRAWPATGRLSPDDLEDLGIRLA